MGRESVIIFATITSVDITAPADKDIFSMTTTDPAQVRAKRLKLKRHVHLRSIQASQKLYIEVQC